MPVDWQPHLEGDLVELRPLRPEDYDDLYAVAADPLIWEQHPESDRHEEERFRSFFRDALASGGALIAIDARTRAVIGSSRFHAYDKDKSEVEIGWTFLARSHWGGIYNGEMKRLMLEHAFRFVKCVVFLVGPENLRSQRAVEKIGGVRAGSRADARGVDSDVYRLTESRFAHETPSGGGVTCREASIADVPAIESSRPADPDRGPADPRTGAHLEGRHHPQHALRPRAMFVDDRSATPDDMTATNLHIDAALVRRLVAARFPEWAGLPITPVEPDGWDNRTFRLGETKAVRLPSAERYAAQVMKEHRWLPHLAPLVPLPIPVPLAMGVPAGGYPWPWSVYRWIDGENAIVARIDDLPRLATTLARFLTALQQIDPAGGPPPGAHNFFRGGLLSTYDAETRDAIVALRGTIDTDAVTAVWEAAVATTWAGSPVWVHGDISAGNLLVSGGRLSAVIDFGSAGVGDPACDVTIAWTLFSDESREAFRLALLLDDATWARGRGWALWKALVTLVEHMGTNSRKEAHARHVINEVCADQSR